MRIWLFAILLVLWGNLLHPLIGSTAILPGGSWPFVVAGAALVAVSFFAARALGLDAATLGLRPAGAFRGFLIGALAGAVVATSAVAIMRGFVPALIGQPVIYEPLSRVAAGELLRPGRAGCHALLHLPEPRLQLPRAPGARREALLELAGPALAEALRLQGVEVALWHGTVAFFTVMNTTMPVVLIVPAIAGAFVVLFVGGVIMAGLRVTTGSLLTTIAAHWAFNAIILVGLRYQRID